MKNQDLKNKIYSDVSVVVATYNGEEFLREQLDSIFAQTVLPKEIVFLDDCSTDSTREIIEEYCSTTESITFKKFFNQKNVGYILNFINGINSASFDIVLLCDQDDIWEKDKIEYIVKFFEKHQDCSVLHSNTKIIDQSGKVIRENAQEYSSLSQKLDVKHLLKKVNYPGMALALKKSKIVSDLNNLVDTDIILPTHDWVICFIAAKDNGFYTSSKVLTLRRFTGKNVALRLKSSHGISERIDGIELYEKYFQFVKQFQNLYDLKLIDIEKYIHNAENRKKYLNEKAIFHWIIACFRFKFYPSFKSYVNDGITIIKG